MSLRRLVLALLITLVGAVLLSSAPPQATAQGLPACNDGVDNDGDGVIATTLVATAARVARRKRIRLP